MLDGLRVLVVEREILIAIDIQRVLEGFGATEVVLARASSDATIFGADLTGFALAVIDAQLGAPEAVTLARALTAAGVPVVVASADHNIAGAFAAHAFLEKPFTENDLIAACITALGARAADGS